MVERSRICPSKETQKKYSDCNNRSERMEKMVKAMIEDNEKEDK